jgi:uridine kinase
MSAPILLSACQSILFDADLLVGGRFSLGGPDPKGRDWRLFAPGDSPQLPRGAGEFKSILSGDPREDGLPLLQTLHREGRLNETLLVTSNEKRIRLARQMGMAVLEAGEGDLLEQISPRSLVMRDTASLMLRVRRARKDRYMVAGINGIDNSGKSGFSEILADSLRSLGLEPTLLSMESFTAAKKERRNRDYPEAERYYRKHYAMDRLREQFLLPLQGGLATSVSYDHYDSDRERISEKRNISLNTRSALLLDGPFLFQEDLSAYFDFRIYLVTDFERAIEIELEDVPEKKRKKHELRFVKSRLGAQSLYLRKEAPWKRAHLVIRGVNTESPVIENIADELQGDPEKAMAAE